MVCSPVYFGNFDVEDYLGRITRDSDGNIVGAEATTMTWFLEIEGEEITDLPAVSVGTSTQSIHCEFYQCILRLFQ